MAVTAGRDVSLQNVLQHELLLASPALAEMNGNLRSGQKSVLADGMIGDMSCPMSWPSSKHMSS